MKIRNKGSLSTAVVFGWMAFLAIAFVVLVFSGSSEAQVVKKSFPFKEGGPIKATQYAPAQMECGVLQIVRIKYTHVRHWKLFGAKGTTSKRASFRRSFDGSALSYKFNDPPYSAQGEQYFKDISSFDPLAVAFGLRLPSQFELKPGQSREIRYGVKPPC